MKIAFDYQIFTWQVYGGISRYFCNLAKELNIKNHEVKIIAPFFKNRYLRDISPNMRWGNYLKQFPPKTSRMFLYSNYMAGHCLTRYYKPDIVHETYFPILPMPTGDAIKVTTVYDMIHERYAQHFTKTDDSAIKKKRAVKRAHHIMAISESTKRDLIEILDIPAEKISVTHLGIDLEEWQLLCNSSEISNDTRPYFLYVGDRNAYYKNFFGLLKAVSSSAHLMKNFNVIAFGSHPFNASEKQLMSDLGFSDSQVCHAVGNDTILASLYMQAAAFIYPSMYEGFGLPPLEAMACGCPVVSSNTSSMPEVIGEAGRYFDPMDIESMRDAIETVVNDTGLRNSLILKGVDRAKQFTWANCAQQTLDAYTLALGGK